MVDPKSPDETPENSEAGVNSPAPEPGFESEVSDQEIFDLIDQEQAAAEQSEAAEAESADSANSAAGADSVSADPVQLLADERLQDLQRMTAEYANYRKRVERDRQLEQDFIRADIFRNLLPVLDDLDRAEKHGDLVDGPFAVIAQKLKSTLERLGLTAFGEAGEKFDPNFHEAIARIPSPESTEETIADVVEVGYKVKDRLVRAAKVAVQVPATE